MSGKPGVTAAPGDHLDDDALVERALAPGSRDAPAVPDARFASMRRVVLAARLDTPGEEVPPPDRVWSAITAELGTGTSTGTGTGQVVPREDESDPAPPVPAVTSLGDRRASARRTAPWMLAAAAAGGLLLGWVAGQAGAGPTPAPSVANPPAGPQQDPVTVLASARLDPLPVGENPTGAVPASGEVRAELDERDGRRELMVRADGLDASSGATAPGGDGGYYEVWLIDVPDGRLVSLGVLDSIEGSFAVPAEIDAEAFSTVDVSFEPLDGEPTHSGASVLRGTLTPET